MFEKLSIILLNRLTCSHTDVLNLPIDNFVSQFSVICFCTAYNYKALALIKVNKSIVAKLKNT